MRKKRKKNFTKAEIQKVRDLEKPDFILKISVVTYDDLKNWNLIDHKTLKEKQKKKINKDFEGGDVDE